MSPQKRKRWRFIKKKKNDGGKAVGGKRKRRVTNVTNLTKQNISACNKMVFDFIKTHELQGLRVCVERSFNLAPFFSLLFFSPSPATATASYLLV